jgi:hypothetical protein
MKFTPIGNFPKHNQSPIKDSKLQNRPTTGVVQSSHVLVAVVVSQFSIGE